MVNYELQTLQDFKLIFLTPKIIIDIITIWIIWISAIISTNIWQWSEN